MMHRTIFFSAIFSICFILCVTSKSIPSYVHLCKRKDPMLSECILKTIKELIPYLKKGIPEMDLPPNDPLTFVNISVNTGSETSVKLDAQLTEGVMYGGGEFEIIDFKSNLENAEFSSKVLFPYLRIEGNYNIKGSILLFQVRSKGKAELNATNTVVEANWKGVFYTKNNKTHLKFEEMKVNPLLEDMHVYFHNLFEGNEVLTETVNRAINDNVKDLVNELRPIIQETIGAVNLDFYNRVYSLYPLEELYPE